MSQDVFQMGMDHITVILLQMITIHNDMCVYGRETKRHDKLLLQLMKMASHKGLVFNRRKCSILQPQIFFHGAIFTAQGKKPDLSKVQALQDLSITNNQTNLQSFFRTNKLSTAFPPQPSIKNNLPERACYQLGLEPLNRSFLLLT